MTITEKYNIRVLNAQNINLSERAKKAKVILENQGFYHDSLTKQEALAIVALWDAEAAKDGLVNHYTLLQAANGVGYDVSTIK